MCGIAVLENYSLFCSGITPVLQINEEYNVVQENKEINSFLTAFNREITDIIIFDIIHNDDEGLSTLKKIKRKTSKIPILLVVNNDYAPFFDEYISMGINGLVFQDSNRDELLRAVDTVAGGDDYFPIQVWQLLKKYLRSKKKTMLLEDEKLLTSREISILKLFCKGYTYKEIGVNLNISPRTVETHKKNIQSKINVKSTAEMVEFAFQNNL